MSSRAAKRMRYSNVKNMLVNDLHALAVDSDDFNNELIAANQDFALMLKSMEDRQNQHLSRSFIIEEKIGEITAILKQGDHVRSGQTSAAVELPSAYSGNIRKFVQDSNTSLAGHAKMLSDQVDEMFMVFHEFEEKWNKKMNDLKGNAVKIVEARKSLGTQLTDFVNNIQ